MKKIKIFLTIFTIMILIKLILFGITVYNTYYKIGEFNLETYEEEFDELIDISLEKIENSEDAKIKAKKVFLKKYDKKDVIKNEPFTVSYDDKNKVWLVEGTYEFECYLPNVGCSGGIMHILIQENNGVVLAIWYDK